MITITPIASSPGHFMATLANGDVVVTTSRTPFLDAARRLLKPGEGGMERLGRISAAAA
jgi:hypothetical protein